MHRVFLGLGANVGDKKKNLGKAIDLLNEKVINIKFSKFYETEPWGYKDQDKFLNTAIMGETSLSPLELLKFVKKTEKQVGRVERFRWGPREIDIDILFYDDLVYKNKDLEIPHPRLYERDFVLRPLMDLEKNFVHPVLQKSIKDLARHIRSMV